MPARSRKDRGRIARTFASGARRRAHAGRDGADVYPLADTAHPTAHPGTTCSSRSSSSPSIDRAADSLTTALSKPGHGVTDRRRPRRAVRGGRRLQPRDHRPRHGAVHGRRRDRGAPARRRHRASCPVLAIAQADDLEERIAPARGGRGRGDHQAVRPGRARGARRGPVAALPAVARPMSALVVASTSIGDANAPPRSSPCSARRAASGPRPSRPTSRSSSAERHPKRRPADRPRPLVRAGRVAPQPAAQAGPAGARPRRGRRCARPTCSGPTRSTTRAASRSSPRRRPRASRR